MRGVSLAGSESLPVIWGRILAFSLDFLPAVLPSLPPPAPAQDLDTHSRGQNSISQRSLFPTTTQLILWSIATAQPPAGELNVWLVP